MKYFFGLLWLQTNVFVEISPPPQSSSPRGSFAMLAREFQIILTLALAALILNVFWVVFFFERDYIFFIGTIL